jgi:hypothetical protein
MRAKLYVPFEELRGRIGEDYYARVLYGKLVIQRCPRRRKPPTPAQEEARKQFVEKYRKGTGKVRDGN